MGHSKARTLDKESRFQTKLLPIGSVPQNRRLGVAFRQGWTVGGLHGQGQMV